MNIWKTISASISFYENLGYTYVDSPWTVEPKYSALTKPDYVKDFPFRDEVLVASGEQSFFQMMDRGELKEGKWCTATPCFRDERQYDELHLPYFLKTELIEVYTKNFRKSNLIKGHLLVTMINDSLQYFNQYISSDKLDVVRTEIGYDIVSDGIELGSYGIRENDFGDSIYGTGVAQPRLNQVLKA